MSAKDEKAMEAGDFSYHAVTDVPAFLRALAEQIEQGEELPESAAIVFGSLGGTVWVDGVGMNGSIETIGLLRLGEHVVLNTLMPFGSTIQK